MNIQRYNEPDFNGFLEDLIQSGRLDDKEIGIIRFYLDNGYKALSEKQRYVFDHTIEENSIDDCIRCAIDIPWCEMLEALDNGGYCNYCQHMMEKEEEDDDKTSLLHPISGATINRVNEAMIHRQDQSKTIVDDSSVNLCYTLQGTKHTHKFTAEQIEAAFEASSKNT